MRWQSSAEEDSGTGIPDLRKAAAFPKWVSATKSAFWSGQWIAFPEQSSSWCPCQTMAIESELAFKRNPPITAIFLTLSPRFGAQLSSDGFSPKREGKGGELVRMVQDQSLILYSFEGFLDSLDLELPFENFSFGLNQKKVVWLVLGKNVKEQPPGGLQLSAGFRGTRKALENQARDPGDFTKLSFGHFAHVHASDQFIGQADRRKQRLPFLDSDVRSNSSIGETRSH